MSDKNVASKLQMHDLYFSEFNFTQNREIQQEKLETNINVGYARKQDDVNEIKVQIDLTIKDKNKSIELFLQTVGIFKLESDELDEKIRENLLKKNTVAIMFPFIRSQVSLMTTQPGVMPILLKPIDVDALIDKE